MLQEDADLGEGCDDSFSLLNYDIKVSQRSFLWQEFNGS